MNKELKTVFIGDVHGRSIWKDIVAQEKADRVIFIGDYFDSFDTTNTYLVHNNNEFSVGELK